MGMRIVIPNKPNGFGLIGLLIIAVIGALVGGVYFSSISGGRSQYDVSRSALKQAQKFTETVREQNERIVDVVDRRLDLSNQGLTSVPQYVFAMTELQEFDLSVNNLTGALPAEIRHLKNLKVLNVSHNKMTGIPAEIGQLSNLVTLDYSYNQITGMPYEMANLKNLRTLNLTGNNFSEYDLAIITKDLPDLRVVK